MPIDFDDLSGAPDDLNPAPQVGPSYGLIVAEKAPSGEALHAEEKLYHQQHHLVIFTEEDEDDPTREVFRNAEQWRKAMGIDHLPTEEECLRWDRRRRR